MLRRRACKTLADLPLSRKHPIPLVQVVQADLVTPIPEAARPRRARPIAPRGRSGAHPNGCWSQPGAPPPPIPPILPYPCKSCNPCLPPFSFSKCHRNSPLPGFRQNWCTFVPLSYHRSFRFHPTLALLLPPRRPIPGGTRNFTKGPAPRKHPPFALPLYIHPMSPVRTYTIRQASTATRTSPTFPRAIPRFTVKSSDQRTTPRSWRHPQQSARCPSPLPGSRFHSPFPPIRCHCRKPPATAHSPGRFGRMFPTPFRKNPRTIRTHLFHSIQIKNTNFSNFS